MPFFFPNDSKIPHYQDSYNFVHARLLSHVRLCDPHGLARQAPLSMGRPRPEYCKQNAISYSRGSSQPRAQIHASSVSFIGRQIIYHCATWETLCSTYFPATHSNMFELETVSISCKIKFLLVTH